MNANRKSKSSLQNQKNSRSESVKKRPLKQVHLLAKPNLRSVYNSKHTNSSTTLTSHNFSRTSSKQKNAYQNHHQKQALRQIQGLVSNLENELRLFKKSQNNSDFCDWFLVVERTCKNITNQQIKKVKQAVQKGYQYCCEKKKNDFSLKEGKKLTLNIGEIKKQAIPDYQDEFMSKLEEYSPSWRALIEAEQKRKS